MANTRVVITDYIEPNLEWEEEQFEQLEVDFAYHQLRFGTPEQILEVTADADVIVTNMARLNAQVIEGLDRCQLIIRHGIGYDNIDVETATERGIMVAIEPDYCVLEVAEQTVMLIFACQRKLLHQRALLRQWVDTRAYVADPIRPIHRLHGRTVGIVGLGRIGSTVYQMLQGMGLKFLVCDPYIPEAKRRKYPARFVGLEEVLRESDIVTIHTPLNKETYHLIGAPQLELMKETAVLINTARGPIVNEAALERALREGKIAHAGIDVYRNEPPPPDLPLLRNEKAICTPHSAWYSEEAAWIVRQDILGDVKRFLQGQGPRNQVNPEVQLRTEEE